MDPSLRSNPPTPTADLDPGVRASASAFPLPAGSLAATDSNPTDFDRWRQARLGEGYDEVLVREWAAQQVLPEHTHPFGVSALVVRGEFWLGCSGSSRHLKAGDGFTLAGQVPHTERYGAEGATVWVARRHAG